MTLSQVALSQVTIYPSTLLNNRKYDQFRNVQKTKHGRKIQPIRKRLPTKRQTQWFTWKSYDEAGYPWEKLNDILRNQETIQVNNPNNVTEIKDNQTQPIQIRSFRPHLLNPETENLIIGSSIISRINQNDLPRDVAIHAYPGSTTDEKAGILDSNENKQLRTITLQDGTNSLLKQRSVNVKNHFEKHKTVSWEIIVYIKAREKIHLRNPPVKNDDTVNERIRTFNNLLNN